MQQIKKLDGCSSVLQQHTTKLVDYAKLGLGKVSKRLRQ
jgi:hypothetical protein